MNTAGEYSELDSFNRAVLQIGVKALQGAANLPMNERFVAVQRALIGTGLLISDVASASENYWRLKARRERFASGC